MKQRASVTTSNFFLVLLGRGAALLHSLALQCFVLLLLERSMMSSRRCQRFGGPGWGGVGVIIGHCCAMAWASLPFFIRAFLITSHPQGYDECSGKVRQRRERSVLVRPIAVVEGIHRGQGKIWKICARLRSCGT